MQKLTSSFMTFIFAGLLIISSHGMAEEATTETWYQIEVLVYEPVEQTLAGEVWPANVDTPLPDDTIELMPVPVENNGEAIAAFQQLPPETLVLAETANKLIASRQYRIITLQGWQQPVKQRNEAESVHLTDKPVTDNESDTTPVIIENGETILNQPTETNEPQGLDNTAKIDGTVTVSLSRYLHMALKLNYYNPDVYLAEQIALQKPDEVLINTFAMNQSRRMRSKEIHVFDHPYFGVITTITPVERIKDPGR